MSYIYSICHVYVFQCWVSNNKMAVCERSIIVYLCKYSLPNLYKIPNYAV